MDKVIEELFVSLNPLHLARCHEESGKKLIELNLWSQKWAWKSRWTIAPIRFEEIEAIDLIDHTHRPGYIDDYVVLFILLQQQQQQLFHNL